MLADKNIEILKQYLDNNMPLVPVYKDYYQCQNKETKQIILLNTEAELLKYIKYGIEIFLVYPSKNNLIAIDIDRKDQGDGLKNFYHFLKTKGIKNPILANVENHPVYTLTKSKGYHLLFKLSDTILSKTIKSSSGITAVDYRYRAGIIAAGSIKHGGEYTLYGNLKDIPQLPYADERTLFLDLHKTQRKIYNSQEAEKNYSNIKDEKYKFKIIENILKNSRAKHSNESPHYKLFYMAKALQYAGFEKKDIEAIITNQPEHEDRNDQYDTITMINSIFTTH